MSQNRQRLSKVLQLHGYSACLEALVILEDHFTRSNSYQSLEDFLSQLNRVITFDTQAESSIIDPDLANLAIKHLSANSKRDVELDQTNLEREIEKDMNIRVRNVQYEQQGDFQLMKLDSLTASTQPNIRCICLGLLTKDISKIDGYLLIDSTGRVPLRITPDTTFRNRLAYSNCIVLVEGVYVNPDDVLFAANVGLPPVLLDPIEDKSLSYAEDKLVIILRELFLDDEDIVGALDILFTGYNSMENPPLVFILIGDFTREHISDSKTFRMHMRKLIRILKSCDNLKECHFVFVPGPKDTTLMPSSGGGSDSVNLRKALNNMPKCPLTEEQFPMNLLKSADFNNIHLATNPAHIYLGDRQISVVAHSYLKQLKKNLLHDLSDHREELFETAKQLMLSNAHLETGVTKTYHSSMNLWHKPDLLILADTEATGNRYDYSAASQHDTSFTTVPSFACQFNQFKVYYLKTGDIEDSQVSADALRDLEVVEIDKEVEESESRGGGHEVEPANEATEDEVQLIDDCDNRPGCGGEAGDDDPSN